MELDHLIAVGENCIDDGGNEIVWQILVRNGKVEQTNRVVAASQGDVRTSRDNRWREFRHRQPQCGNLLARERDVAHLGFALDVD